MLLKNYMVLAACCTFLSATPGHVGADHDEEADYPFYGGFAIGFAEADEDCDYYGYDCDGDDTSVKFYGGKRLHENLAIELSFQDLGKLDDKRGSVTATAETTGVNLSLHGIIPIDDVGYLYGKIGMMAWETDYTEITPSTRTTSDDDGTDFTFGAGFAFTFNERYDFRVEFERLNELDDNFTPGGDYITVFSFGGTVYIR